MSNAHDAPDDLVGVKVIHPGAVLRNEFMKVCNLSTYKLALALGLQPERVRSIIVESRNITPETALRLARYFNTSPRFWMDLQTEYELRQAQLKWNDRVNREVTPGKFAVDFGNTCDRYDRAMTSQARDGELSPKQREIRITDTDQIEICRVLRGNPKIHLDWLETLVSMKFSILVGTLTLLELASVVIREPGDWYYLNDSIVIIEESTEAQQESESIPKQTHEDVTGATKAEADFAPPSADLEVTGHVPNQEADSAHGTH